MAEAPDMCICEPGDGTNACPHEDECRERWYETQRRPYATQRDAWERMTAILGSYSASECAVARDEEPRRKVVEGDVIRQFTDPDLLAAAVPIEDMLAAYERRGQADVHGVYFTDKKEPRVLAYVAKDAP